MLAPLFVAPFFVEHFRGGWLLKAQAREMAARGEPLDSTNLWPEISAKSIEFSKSLDQVVSQVSPRLRKYAGAVTACMPDNSGNWHRGSQMPWPVIQGSSSTTSWEELGAAIEQDHVAVQQLRELMKNPPAGVACKLKDDFELNSVPNFVQVRVGAQILQAAAMNDLHNGNSALALEDILAMRRFTKLYAADPSLVSLMIRIAIVGIASDVCWDALQAKDWSEEKLERLQTACELDRDLLSDLPRAYFFSRAARLHEIELFRTHSYEAWIARMEPMPKSFGVRDEDIAASLAPRALRQWALHPLWSFCCADQEAVNYLRATQEEYQSVRRITEHRSWCQLANDLSRARQNYHAPPASWRFYTTLPLFDEIPKPGGSAHKPGEFPYAPYDHAWRVTMKNLTVNELVITAIAIKRFDLRHGNQTPTALAALVPEFLTAVPVDFMDGQPLRYRSVGGAAFRLYSVGDDAVDDGGETSGTGTDSHAQSPWSARDCVWPGTANN
jgi:hypothetical protein